MSEREVTLDLSAMAHGGAAFGRAADGRVIFVHGGLPGEHVQANLTDSRERYAHAVLAATPDAPSADRIVDPPCPHFGQWPERGALPATFCGGCTWQHATYEAQLRYKADVLRDALSRLGGFEAPTVHPTLPAPDPWRYRNRLTVRGTEDGPGMVAVDGRTILPISACHIAHPLVAELLEAVGPALVAGAEATLRAGTETGDQLVALRGLGEDVEHIDVEAPVSVVLEQPDGSIDLVAGRPFLWERLAGHVFSVPALSFFQVHTAMAEQLVALTRAALGDGVGTLVDVYSGVGAFSVSLADLADQIFAIESDPRAVAAAADNASGIEHLTLLEADAAEGLAYLDEPPDAVIVDPPRTGLERRAVQLLARRARDRIVYVSCEPSTLARDARQLAGAGWTLVDSQPVDMFPQTYHVESVTVFRRSETEGHKP